MTIGEKLKELRRTKGFSQELLADEAGLSLRTIQRIEKNSSSPRLYTLKTLAEVLQVNLEQLNVQTNIEASNSNSEVDTLRLINFCSLVFLILPIFYILIPIFIWRKHRQNKLINKVGRSMISFQVIWMIITVMAIFLTPLMSMLITGSSAPGQLPIIPIVYLFFVMINLFSIIRNYNWIHQNNWKDMTSLPPLF